jgi:hypothetical protein
LATNFVGGEVTAVRVELSPPPEVAYYYPNATWRHSSSDFIKNLLLYFDGVSVLVPEYLRDKQFKEDPDVAPVLEQEGLLHLLLPEKVIDKAVTEKLVASATDILVTGALDKPSTTASEFHSLSYSRLGFYGDEGLARMLLEELEKRGLARRSEDGHSIPMDPIARSMILVLLAQILRAHSPALRISLSPATDRPEVLGALRDLLKIPELPTAAQVVNFDLARVGVDVSGVPIEQILAFRQRHGYEYRTYARDGSVPPEERPAAYADRHAELTDRASELARQSQGYWRRPAAFYLGLLGAMAALGNASGWGALFAVGGAFAGLSGVDNNAGGAFSYIFRSRHLQA